LPFVSATVFAFAAPLKATVAPFPPTEGLIIPETLQVGTAVATKLTLVAFALLIVNVWLGGLNVNPVLLGVTV
jgi:hypothetical protein